MSGILNAVGNATTALATIGGLTRPGGLAQPSVIASNLAVPGVPLVSFRDYFLTSMESWVSTIPLRTQYIALITNFPKQLNTSVIQSLELTQDGSKKGFDINAARAALCNYPLQSIVGCIFLDGVNIPDDTLEGSFAPIENNRGFNQGSILANRAPFANNNLTLQFRETNTSFVDAIMRPWTILASHQGYVAQPNEGETGIKSNIIIIQYSRTYQNVSQIPRKIWTYYNCVPLGVSTRNLSYDVEKVETYDVPFIYDSYTVEFNLYLPLPDLISKIGSGSLPRI